MQPPQERGQNPDQPPRIEIILFPLETLYASSVRGVIEGLKENYLDNSNQSLQDFLESFFDDDDSKAEIITGYNSLTTRWLILHPDSINAQIIQGEGLAAPLFQHLAFLFEVFPPTTQEYQPNPPIPTQEPKNINPLEIIENLGYMLSVERNIETTAAREIVIEILKQHKQDFSPSELQRVQTWWEITEADLLLS